VAVIDGGRGASTVRRTSALPSDLLDRTPLPGRGDLHLVRTGIGVGNRVTHVGDVHHVPDVIALPPQADRTNWEVVSYYTQEGWSHGQFTAAAPAIVEEVNDANDTL
jgi:hypothetical protein